MKPIKTLAILLENFKLGQPSQQLLDRFKIGFQHDGKWRQPGDRKVIVHVPEGEWSAELDRRASEFGLLRAPSRAAALREADAVLVVPRGLGMATNEELIEETLAQLPEGRPCFVHGVLANNLVGARRMVDLARRRKIPLVSGSALAAADQLPPVDIELNAPLKEALVVVQGSFASGEHAGLGCLLPLIERRAGGETGVNRVYRYAGSMLWNVVRAVSWPRHLLAPALSRSNSPQGDPVKDGRTQDLEGLKLVKKLAVNPRGWMIHHKDGFRSTILILDGVVEDFNFAVERKDGTVVSAQVHRPPLPNDDVYSRLAAAIDAFFETDQTPWPTQRAILEAHLMELFLNLSLLGGSVADVSALKPPIAYRPER